MFHLTQYIVVRRDLPLEDILPQACHAAGKAMFCYAAKIAQEHPQARWPTLNPDWGHPTRIVRGSKNEGRLRKLAGVLTSHGIDFVTITEPDDGPLKGQMTALALFPGEKDKLGPLLNDFQNLRWRDVPSFPGGSAPHPQGEAGSTPAPGAISPSSSGERRASGVAEQRGANPQVAGSTPALGSTPAADHPAAEDQA